MTTLTPEVAPATPALEQAVTHALVGVFALPGLYLLWASLPWPLIHDAPLMHYLAWRISEGAVPYRDLFDMNQPGALAIHRAILWTLGDGDFAWRLFDLAWLALGVVAIAALARPWGTPAAAGSATLFAVYHLSGGAWHAGQRDFLLCPPLLLGALGVARWIEGAPGVRSTSLGWGGLLLGAAVTIKPPTALYAAALGAVVAVVAWRRRALRPLPIFLAGVGILPAVAFGWIVARGAFPAWREIVLDYLIPLYSHVGRPADWTFYRWHVWIPIGVAVVLSLASAAWYRRLRWRHGIATLGVAYGLLHFFGQGKGWEYHLYPLAAFAAVLAFAEIDALVRHRAVLTVPLGATLVALAVLLTLKGAAAANADWVWDKERLVRLLVSDLGSRMRPGDRVQVLDTTEGGIHALLRLRAVEPTRFLYDFHFLHDVDAPMIRKLRAEILRDLVTGRPRFIVAFERGWPAGTYDRFERFPELLHHLETAYTMVEQRDGYVIFAKRDDP